jgi:DNA-binding GntR family transcriptional regulator
MRELAAQGWISLRRGRPARVLWTGSFRGSARRAGRQLITRTFHTAYRPLDPTEAAIGDDLGLDQDRFCIVCGRVRVIDGYPAAISLAYINPVFFSDPASFFLDHDVVAGSLRDVYSSLGVRPLRIPAMLKPALADEQERLLLGVAPCTPVLRAYQQTLVEWHGDAYVLEVMKGTYTDAVDYRVDRLTDWSALELTA